MIRKTGIILVIIALTPLWGPLRPAHAARTLVDPLGRTVSMPDRPVRVVALAPSVTEIVYALNRQDRLCGATQFSNYPEQAAALPKVGSYIRPDLERIAALSPDLVIGVKDGNPKAAVDRLAALSIPLFAVDPRDTASLLTAIRAVGEALNADAEANALVADLAARIGNVRRTAATADEKPGVFFQIGVSPIVSAGANTFLNELITLAGGRNLTAGGASYPRLTFEQVIALRPEVMLIATMEQEAVYTKVLAAWEKWPMIPAVKNRRIHLVNADLCNRPSPRTALALETIAALIHPELFPAKAP